MATDWSSPAPQEMEKQGHYLHTREQIPTVPQADRKEMARRWGIVLLGCLFTIGLAAMAFQTYAAWEDTRDFLLVTMVSICGVAGVALGYLVYRGRWDYLTPAIFLIIAGAALIGMNAMRATVSDGEDLFRDFLSIAGGVVLLALFVYLIVAMILVELREPTRAPAPEM